MAIAPFACLVAASDWPDPVERSLWVPSGAYDMVRSASGDVYALSYKLNLCHPANEYLGGLVGQMNALGWRRQEFNPFNPNLRTNHARRAGGVWDLYHNRPDGYDVLQWIDDWEDAGKNVARYCLRYKVVNKDFQNACTLEVTATYFPAHVIEDLGTGE